MQDGRYQQSKGIQGPQPTKGEGSWDVQGSVVRGHQAPPASDSNPLGVTPFNANGQYVHGCTACV